jgi:hypothetical protein
MSQKAASCLVLKRNKFKEYCSQTYKLKTYPFWQLKVLLNDIPLIVQCIRNMAVTVL